MLAEENKNAGPSALDGEWAQSFLQEIKSLTVLQMQMCFAIYVMVKEASVL